MVVASHQLANLHGDRGREAGHHENGPVTAEQQAEGAAGESPTMAPPARVVVNGTMPSSR